MLEKSLKKLNSELEGVIMGENAIKNLKEKASDYKLIELLDKTVCIAEKNKKVIIDEIERLRGKATQNEGVFGKVLEIFNNIREMTVNTDREVIEKAIEGTEMGFKAILDFLIKEDYLSKDFKNQLINISDEYSNNIKEMQEYLVNLV